MRVGGEDRDLFNADAPAGRPRSLNYEMWLGQAPLDALLPGPLPRQLPLEPGLLRRRA